jgi:serine/threonine protein kinase
MIGQKLNQRYTITARLGEGGMGEVYQGNDEQTGQPVAVKVLARHLSSHPESLERFKREAKTLRQLEHPNIVKFVDSFEYEAQYVIVMEYVPGGSLHDLLRQGLLPLERARQIALDLCDALIHTHRLKIIHRDIKPENVLIDQHGTPKLADFGVARLSEDTQRMTRSGTMVGTPYYMAPEAWEGEKLDAQADIWSLGVVLFEMLSGQLPFRGDTPMALMTKVCTTPPPDLKELRAEVPLSLAEIVNHMLTRDKRRRYPTMREVAVDLERNALNANPDDVNLAGTHPDRFLMPTRTSPLNAPPIAKHGSAEAKRGTLDPRLLIRIVSLVTVTLIILSGTYIGGSFVMPNMIKAIYQGKNCELALELDNIYASLYPASLADKSIASPLNECAIYSLASDNEQQKAWKDSYNSYKIYTDTYPTGLFAAEAREHSALTLTALAKEQTAQKKYNEAIGSLNLIADRYSDITNAATEATNLIPEVYIAWGADLRNSNDFIGSENTLKAFTTWAGRLKKSESVKSAKYELAQTYLAWGLDLQSQKKFDDAKTKLDLAAATDPEPLSDAGPTAQAKRARVELQNQLGDELLEQKNFAEGIEQYKAALNFSDQPAVKDTIVNGYLKWAASLAADEDFSEAFKQVNEAEKNASTDTARKSVLDAKDSIYLAFSMSSGEQAQKAMEDAVLTICRDGKRPDLPIFGLDKDHIFASAYIGPDVDAKLPDSVAAKTPGAMHYLACIEQESKIIDTTTINNYGAKPATLVREQYTWHVTLWKLDTLNPGESAQTQKFDLLGGTPPPFPSPNKMSHEDWLDILFGGSYQHFRGQPPSMDDLATRLLTTMK